MSFQNLGNVAAQLGSIDARLNAIAGRKLPPLGPYDAQIGVVSSRLDALNKMAREASTIVPGTEATSSFPNQQTPEWFRTQLALARTPPTSVLGEISTGFPSNLKPGETSSGGFSASQGSAGPAWGELQSPQDILRSRGMQGPAGLEEGNAFADVLDAAADRFDAGFPNGYFSAVVLRMEIPYLRIGARSVAEVKLYIQSFAPFFLPGFQKAVLDPGLSPLERSLTNEAIRILMSGSVSAGGGGGGGALAIPAHRVPTPAGELTPGPRPSTASTTTPETTATATAAARTTAGVSSDTRGVSGGVTGPGAERTVTAAVTSLHSAVSSANEEWRRQFNELRGQFLTQGGNIHELGQHFDARAHEMLSGIGDLRGLGAAQQQKVLDQLRLVQSDVRDPKQQQKVLDRLKLVQDDFRERIDPRHLFQPVIDGYLRPLRENMFSPRDLNAALRTLLATQRLPT